MIYCDKCRSEQHTTVTRKPEIFYVLGKRVETKSLIRICCNCGEELFDEKLDTDNLDKVYRKYEKIYGNRQQIEKTKLPSTEVGGGKHKCLST